MNFTDVVRKNVGTWVKAYGMETNSAQLVEMIIGRGQVVSVGVLLRDIVTKEEAISCRFPVNRDISAHLLWVPFFERKLEPVPIVASDSRGDGTATDGHSGWQKLLNKISGNKEFSVVTEGEEVAVRVHRSLRQKAVVEKYFPVQGYGFLRRSRGGIYFRDSWSDAPFPIKVGSIVSFVPVISRKGVQARALEPTMKS